MASDLKTSLGIWALGPMVTRFVPVGYQPEHAAETTAEKVRRAVEGLGDLVDDYEFHYPAELSPDNLDEVREALDGHGIYAVAAGLHLDPRFGKGGLVSPDPAIARRGAAADARGAPSFAGSDRRALHRLARDRGLQLPLPVALPRGVGVAHRRHGPGGRGARAPRAQAVPRAQELRARDEDPHGQHRDDAARHPQAARPGDRQRPGQHGLAAPDHERREPRRVRGAARRRGAARPPARATRAGARSTTTTWSARRRSWRPSSWRSSCGGRTTARAASASASTSTRTPRTRSPPCAGRSSSGASSTRSPGRIDDARAARGAVAQGRASPPTSSSTRRSAHGR